MAAPVYDRIFSQDITQKIETRHGGGLVFNGNNGSMTLGVRLYDGSEPLAPSGAVTGQVIRADGQTALTEAGTIDGNLVSVTLNQSCFAVEGPIVASISVTEGGVKTTVLRAVFTVALTSSGPVIDPGHVVPSVDDIIAKQEELDQDVADASSAIASAQNAVSYLAPGFSTSRTYAVGEYATQDGALYICTTAVETAGAWDASKWQTVTFGEEVTDLKSALTLSENEIFGEHDDTFPMEFENGTYRNISVGSTLEKYYGGGYDLTRKVVKSTVFNAPCSTTITAKSGYGFTVFTANNNVITATSDVVTNYTLESGKQYGITLRTIDGTGDISALSVDQIVEIAYESSIAHLNQALDESVNLIADELIIDYSNVSAMKITISSGGNWQTTAGSNRTASSVIEIPNIVRKIIVKANSTNLCNIAFLKSFDALNISGAADFATGYNSRITIPVNTEQEFILPDDANYFYCTRTNSSGVDTTPTNVVMISSTAYDISDLQKKVAALRSCFPDYSGKRLSILGDSISTFALPSEKTDGKASESCTTNYPGNPVQYSNSDVTSVDLTWWGRVLNQFGMVLGINESWAGSTIGYNPSQTAAGKYTADNCLCSATRIGHLGENGTPDIIIVFGGTNDINHHKVGSGNTLRYAVGELDSEHNPYDYDNYPMVTETYYGSITTMLLRIQHTYPNATILMLLPYFCTYTHTSSGDRATPYDQNEWSKAAIDVCKYLGVEYLDLRSIINLYDVSALLFDGLHPKANGMAAIANAVIHKLNSML